MAKRSEGGGLNILRGMMAIGNHPVGVNIRFDGEEYRVPGKNRQREEEAYYTDDREDAIGTAKLIHGPGIKIHFIRKISD